MIPSDPARAAVLRLQPWSGPRSGQVILLVDGTGLLVRCSRAARSRGIHSSDGTPTGTLLLFIRALARKLRSVQPEYLVVAWDGPAALEWRRSLWPGYKAGSAAPEHEGREAAQARDFCETAGMRQLSERGFEADDIIAACWRQSREEIPEVGRIICSDDADLLQLLGDGITVTTGLTSLDAVTPEDVARTWGVGAAYLPLVRALAGDRSDGIPGLPGIGPGRAVEALRSAGMTWPLPDDVLGRLPAPPEGGSVAAWHEIMELAGPKNRPAVTPGIAGHAAWHGGYPEDLGKFFAAHEMSVLLRQWEGGTLW